MKVTNTIKRVGALLTMFSIVQITPGFAQDLQILGGFYDQANYAGYPIKGTYKVELTKDNYSFTADQFDIIIALPQQGSYDPARAAEAVIPTGWELVVNSNQSLVLRLLAGNTYTGSGAPVNRRKDFYIPIITSAPVIDNPSLVTVQWNDFFVDELPGANTAGSSLNVADTNLPVVLISFKASKEGSTALLNWATTAETNSDHFEIQRSVDGKKWSHIGSVASGGESTVLRQYTYTDKTPLQGSNLYRLRMVDKDESFAYSSIKSVQFGEPSAVAYVYPNPSTDKVFLNIQNLSFVKQISVVDMNGLAVVTTKNVTGGIDVKGLSAGAYLLRVANNDGSSSVHKFLISR